MLERGYLGMCRLAAYIGPTISLQRFLLDPPHSLVRQAWAPREMHEGALSADGYGVGWYDERGRPARYVNPQPIWSDINLDALGRSLSAASWVGNVRGATPDSLVSAANTQPFADAHWLFLHNGRIGDFARRRAALRRRLSPEIEACLRGDTDSEVLFALLRQFALDAPSLEAALRALLALLSRELGADEALLNFVVADGARLVATRHALNAPCPSLYYAADAPGFSGGVLVASEPLMPSPAWQAVPEHALLVLAPGRPAAFLPL